MSRSTRSSAGSDDGTTSVVSRKWGGSELGGTGSSTWTSDSSDVMSLEFVGKRGSFISSNEIMRTEQVPVGPHFSLGSEFIRPRLVEVILGVDCIRCSLVCIG